MTDAAFDAFLATIMKNLATNGYPGNRVSLPLERMYEVAHQKGLNFNKVLIALEERGVLHEKTTAKILFFAKPSDPDMAAQVRLAEEMLSKMSPEEKEKLEAMYREMTPDQMAELKRQAAAMGLL